MKLQPLNHLLKRRSFVKASSLMASASVLGVLPLSSAEDNPAPKPAHKIKLGLVGCGGRGSWIAKLFQKHGGYEIHAVADYFQAVADKCGDELGVDRSRRFSTLS